MSSLSVSLPSPATLPCHTIPSLGAPSVTPFSTPSATPHFDFSFPATKHVSRQCGHCSTTTTKVWRSGDGKILCNSCGLYWKRNLCHRPAKLLQRQRVKKEEIEEQEIEEELERRLEQLQSTTGSDTNVVMTPSFRVRARQVQVQLESTHMLDRVKREEQYINSIKRAMPKEGKISSTRRMQLELGLSHTPRRQEEEVRYHQRSSAPRTRLHIPAAIEAQIQLTLLEQQADYLIELQSELRRDPTAAARSISQQITDTHDKMIKMRQFISNSHENIESNLNETDAQSVNSETMSTTSSNANIKPEEKEVKTNQQPANSPGQMLNSPLLKVKPEALPMPSQDRSAAFPQSSEGGPPALQPYSATKFENFAHHPTLPTYPTIGDSQQEPKPEQLPHSGAVTPTYDSSSADELTASRGAVKRGWEDVGCSSADEQPHRPMDLGDGFGPMDWGSDLDFDSALQL